MELTLLVLKNPQVTLVSLCEQLEYEPKVHLKKPHVVSGKTKLTLTRWPDYTEDDHVLITSDNLLTVCEASPTVRAAYLKKIEMTEEDLKPKEEPKVLLNEGEDPPEDEWIDDYEPTYREA